MSKNTFTPGSEVYDIHGRAGKYIAAVASGHVVEPIYQADCDDAPYYDEPQTWREVFAKPPVARLHAEIAELEQVAAEKRADLVALDEAARAAKAATAEAQARIKAHPQLADLDLFLSGKLTHVVSIDSYSFEIGPIEEIAKRRSSVSRGEFRLISVYGSDRNNLRWKMAQYSDGSGNQTAVLLATSYEHALQLAAEWLPTALQEIKRNGWHTTGIARDAVRYGLPLSDEWREKIAAEDATRKAKELAHARKALAEAQASLAELEGGAA